MGINGESTSMVWPTLGSQTAKEQNSSVAQKSILLASVSALKDHKVLNADLTSFLYTSSLDCGSLLF